MESWLGASVSVFLGLAVMVGSAAFLTGQAIANHWRPARQAVLYCLLLAVAWRFLSYALFQSRLLSLTGFSADAALAIAIGLVAYRITYVRKMFSQYPWLYQRRGLWTFEERK